MNLGVPALQSVVRDAVSRALDQVVPARLSGADPVVRRSSHADYQANGALSLAKRTGTPPRDLAAAVCSALDATPLIARAETAGPGFVNITLNYRAVWRHVAERVSDPRLGVGTPEAGRRTVIDYSAPNIAKEMHVGHLRTTIIGDALARILDFLGAVVTRQNHLGDWGTQFGMLIQYLDEHPEAAWRRTSPAGAADSASSVSALDALYRTARATFDADAGFADRARARVVALQAGDPATMATWRDLVAESQNAFQAIYDRLGVLLAPGDVAGESTYNDALPDVVDELVAAGVAQRSDDAVCVFFDDVAGPDGTPVPLIVQKRDGGHGYATTDLATLKRRVQDLEAQRILYVVDARQAQHFHMVFSAARRVGYLPPDVEAVHVPFGTVLDRSGRPFKTRTGGTVRLGDLLDAAVQRAREVLSEKNPDLDGDTFERVANDAAIGALKYADLSNSRLKDYVFDIDRMVSFTGDTGVYLQYAHARVRSILRRLPDYPSATATVDDSLDMHPAELALALMLDEFGTVLGDVALTLEPHRLCNHLYALARAFTEFYDACPVLKAEDDSTRTNRTTLCRLTGDTLAQGLDLLGIAAPERM